MRDPLDFRDHRQAKLYALEEGTVAAAVQSDDDAVHFLSSGIRHEDHGDHADIAVTEPASLATPVTGPRPFHVIDHDGQVVISIRAATR